MAENDNNQDKGITLSPSELEEPRDVRYIRKSFDKDSGDSIEG